MLDVLKSFKWIFWLLSAFDLQLNLALKSSVTDFVKELEIESSFLISLAFSDWINLGIKKDFNNSWSEVFISTSNDSPNLLTIEVYAPFSYKYFVIP